MKHLYTYLPKDNTAATEGVLSTALAPAGWEKYIARSGKTTKEDVLQWLDNLDPGFIRSQAISVFTSPISDEAHPDIKAFRDSKELVVLPQYNDLKRLGIVDAIVRANRGRRGTTRVKYPQYRDIDWASIKPGRFLLSNAPHYLITTTEGRIPPDMIMTKQDFSREMLKEIDKIRSKYGLPLLAVTDGASITRNNGNDTIKKLRDILKKLEKKLGQNPEGGWMKKTSEYPQYHTVSKGNTFLGLDRQYKLPSGSFQKANQGVDPVRLQIGQRLNVPHRTSMQTVVAPGSPVQTVNRRPSKWAPKKWPITPEWTQAHQIAYETIAGNEDFKDYVYNDTAGKPTIGYGFTRKDLVGRGKITKDEADEILRGYVVDSMNAVNRLPIKTPLNDNQRVVLSDMVYHFGSPTIAKSPDLLRAINSGNPEAVRTQLMRWTKQKRMKDGKVVLDASGKPIYDEVRGLRNRQQRLRDMWK